MKTKENQIYFVSTMVIKIFLLDQVDIQNLRQFHDKPVSTKFLLYFSMKNKIKFN